MKIKKFGFGIVITIIIAILIEYRFFFLIDAPHIIDRLFVDGKYVMISLIGFVVFLYIYLFHGKFMSKYGKWPMIYTWVIMAVVLLFTLYTQSIYPNQKLFDTLANGCRFSCIALFVPFLFILERDRDTMQIMRWLNVIVGIWYIYTICQGIVYSQTGSFLFLFRDYYYEEIMLRNGTLRVGQDPFGAIMLLYNINKLLHGNGHKKGWHLLLCILGGLQIVLIQQTRMMILVCSICIAVEVMYYGHNRNQKIFRALLIIGCGVFLITSPMVSNFLESFLESSDRYGSSTIARMYSLTYLWGVFLENPLMGYAWPTTLAYGSVAHGSTGMAHASDVGFVGMLAELGLFSIVVYIIPVVRMIYILRKTKNAPRSEMRIFLVVLLVFILSSSVTLIITDATRCVGYPFVMALFEYYYRQQMQANANSGSYGSIECR